MMYYAYWLPDHYAVRRWVCAVIGHRFSEHRRIVDYTLFEQHYLGCKRCYQILRETTPCVSQTNLELEDIPRKGKRGEVLRQDGE